MKGVSPNDRPQRYEPSRILNAEAVAYENDGNMEGFVSFVLPEHEDGTFKYDMHPSFALKMAVEILRATRRRLRRCRSFPRPSDAHGWG